MCKFHYPAALSLYYINFFLFQLCLLYSEGYKYICIHGSDYISASVILITPLTNPTMKKFACWT